MTLKRIKFEDRRPHMQWILKQLAAFVTPHMIAKELRTHPIHPMELTPSTIQSYRKRYADEIMEQRKLMREQFPIMNPEARYAYLQQVIENSLGGTPITMPGGASWIKYDHASVINAVKEANNMTGYTKRAVDPEAVGDDGLTDEESRSLIVKDAFADYIKEHGGTFAELLESFSNEMKFPEAGNYLNEEDFKIEENGYSN